MRSRWLPLVAATLLGLAAPATVHGQTPPQTATDADTGAVFTYTAGQVTVDLAGAPALAEAVPGLAVQFICLTDIQRLIGAPIDLDDPAVAAAEQTWPAGQTQVTATLSRVLASADTCGLERDGGEDLAWAAFTPAGKDPFGKAGRHTAVRRLAVAVKAARADALARPRRHFARPRALVRIIRRRASRLRVERALDHHAVARARVVYVLDTSTRGTLRLAYRTAAGDLVRLRHVLRTGATRILPAD